MMREALFISLLVAACGKTAAPAPAGDVTATVETAGLAEDVTAAVDATAVDAADAVSAADAPSAVTP